MVKPLRVGLLLSRTPIITPKPAPFLQAYYKYMSELEKRLMWTFPSFFFFKKGTLTQRKFNELQKGPIARNKNIIFAQGEPDVHFNRDRRFKQEIILEPDEQEKVREQPTVTEADTKNDIKSLERKIEQTLYLLVNLKSENKWKLPSFEVPDNARSLHYAADNGLRSLGGDSMNTWTVSYTPAAILKSKDNVPEFLIKKHILQGVFQPDANVEFAWLCKNEIKEKVDEDYFKQIEVLL